MHRAKIGILGATSLVGKELIVLLNKDYCKIAAFSRFSQIPESDNVIWNNLSDSTAGIFDSIDKWLCVAPIWVLQEHFALLESYNIRRIVSLSSTSRFSKQESFSKSERVLAASLKTGEEKLESWASSKGIEWVILRPTLMYGFGQDKNIAEIARFIRRFGFFPLIGKAEGLRQPIHITDVANACIAVLHSPHVVNCSYNISGGEILSYREMVRRIFVGLNLSPRFVSIPFIVFSLAVSCLRLLPKYRKWSIAMAQRMNSDLVFDHAIAKQDFKFSPRSFQLSSRDLPPE